LNDSYFIAAIIRLPKRGGERESPAEGGVWGVTGMVKAGMGGGGDTTEELDLEIERLERETLIEDFNACRVEPANEPAKYLFESK